MCAHHGALLPNRYKLILDGNLVFPEHVKPQCRDLVRNLVQPTVSKRLGCLRSGSVDVKAHPWFGQVRAIQCS